MIRNEVRLSLQETGGQETFYDRCWTSYNLDHDIREWPMTWRLTVGPGVGTLPDALLASVRRNPVARAYVDSTLIATGRIEAWQCGGNRTDGTFINLEGVGPLGPATEDHVPLGWSPAGMTIRDALTSVLAKWSIPIIGDYGLERAAVTRRTRRMPNIPTGRLDTAGVGQDAQQTMGTGVDGGTDHTETVLDDREVRAKPGENRAAWIARFLAHHKLLGWETPTGALFVGRPHDTQPPCAQIIRLPDGTQPIREGYVVESKLDERPGRQPTTIRVTGRVGRAGATRIAAAAHDLELNGPGWNIRQVVVDDQVRDEAQAQSKADLLMAVARMKSYEYEADVSGHGVGRYLLGIDTVVHVQDAACHIDGEDFYVCKRSFAYDRKQGTTLRIGAVRPGLWQPGQE